MKNIVFIGSGNVATNLAIALQEKGKNIIQIYSKNIQNAKQLATILNTDYTTSLNKLKNGDLYIVAIKDDAINDVIKKIPNKPIVHTSGPKSIDIFKKKFNNFGVLYPLQTFNKSEKIDFSNIPLCIEANNIQFQNKILNIAKQLSNTTILLDSIKRYHLHIAAVFACNFSNHMFTISHKILSDANIDFQILLPLIKQTVNQLKHLEPKKLQTGPARRKDKKIINEHIAKIKDKKHKKIYKIITNAIIEINE